MQNHTLQYIIKSVLHLSNYWKSYGNLSNKFKNCILFSLYDFLINLNEKINSDIIVYQIKLIYKCDKTECCSNSIEVGNPIWIEAQILKRFDACQKCKEYIHTDMYSGSPFFLQNIYIAFYIVSSVLITRLFYNLYHGAFIDFTSEINTILKSYTP